MTQEMQPKFMSWTELDKAMEPLHMNEKRYVDKLHDVWRRGVPSPTSVIPLEFYRTHGFDERKHNFVKRLVVPKWLAGWMLEVSTARGIPFTREQAENLAGGRLDYGKGILNE